MIGKSFHSPDPRSPSRRTSCRSPPCRPSSLGAGQIAGSGRRLKRQLEFIIVHRIHLPFLRTRLKQVSPNPRDPKRCEFPEDKSIKMPPAAPAAKNSNYKMHFYSLTRIWSINENVALLPGRTNGPVCLSVSAVLIPFPNLS